MGRFFGLVVLLPIILLIIPVHIFLAEANSGHAPAWASKGVYLTYGWIFLEEVPGEKLNSTVEELKQRPLSPVFNLTLIDVDDEKGTFEMELISSGEKVTKKFYWQAGWEAGFKFLDIYLPPESLKPYTVETLNISPRAFKAYKVSKTQEEQSWFEKNTGILLLYVKIDKVAKGYDVIVIRLLDTNVNWKKAYTEETLNASQAKPTYIQESTTMVTSPLEQASQTIEQTGEAAAEGALVALPAFMIITAVSVVCIIIIVVLRKMHGTTSIKLIREKRDSSEVGHDITRKDNKSLKWGR